MSGTFAAGAAGSDPKGNAASNYGTFSVTQDTTAVTLAWTPLKPFAKWQNANFGSNAGNAAVAGPTANPSGDGIANLMKYALGLNPNTASVAGLPAVTVTGGYLRLQFNRNTAATDIVYEVQASNDLTTAAAWTSIATRTAGATAWTTQGSTVADGGSGPVTVTDATAASGASKRFLRLKVTQP